MVLCDSREHWTHPGSRDTHISGYFERHGIPYRVQKLDVGDYMMEGGRITVDRKQNLEEICKNLTNPADRKRFFAEARRAQELGLKLVVLIESNKYHQPRDILAWRSKYSHVPGTAVYRQMEKLRLAYKVEFRFCPRVSAARTILEILEEHNHEKGR